MEASRNEGQFQRGGKTVTRSTDAYDLRLFRTATSPRPFNETRPSVCGRFLNSNWRATSRSNSARTKSFTISAMVGSCWIVTWIKSLQHSCVISTYVLPKRARSLIAAPFSDIRPAKQGMRLLLADSAMPS